MFIDVTRYGGVRVLRVAVAAIAYLDSCEGGTALHLVGGETLRVAELPGQLEARVDATIALSPIAATAPATAAEGDPAKLADKRRNTGRSR